MDAKVFLATALTGGFLLFSSIRIAKNPWETSLLRPKLKRFFRSMVAHSGTYSVEGACLVHHVDTSWNEAWTGTDQVRNYKLDGERLVLVDGPSPNTRTGKKSVRHLSGRRSSNPVPTATGQSPIMSGNRMARSETSRDVRVESGIGC